MTRRRCWHYACRTVDARVVQLEQAGQEALARAGNILVARTAFDMSVSLPNSTNPRGFPPWRVQSSTHERTEAKT